MIEVNIVLLVEIKLWQKVDYIATCNNLMENGTSTFGALVKKTKYIKVILSTLSINFVYFRDMDLIYILEV
jgi:hypothetical protein